MPSINFREFNDALWRELKVQCAREGIFLREFLERAVKNELQRCDEKRKGKE